MTTLSRLDDPALRDSSAFPTNWGAFVLGDGSTRFRLWAPAADSLHLRSGGRDRRMEPEGEGWFELVTSEIGPGAEYLFVLPDGTAVPDPAARAQAGDVHGPSLVVDPRTYRWRTPWAGRPWEEAVLYELHIGTFTPQGTLAAAAGRLRDLAEVGITAIEIMPVGQFPGSRGWGYDGVLPYAPHNAYGSPDDLRALVDEAHAQGLMVLLDVVYNHFGPEGNYLGLYAPDFFDSARHTPWGAAIAYGRDPVRRFFVENALCWLTEFRLDGLRLDAIDHVRDGSDPEILVELARRVRAEITDRPIHLTTEDNRNVTYLHEREPGGAVPLYTAEWNDDFHNAAHVVATGESEGYYGDFARDHWQLLARALAEGFAYQGEVAPQTGEPRGRPSGHLQPDAFVDFLQNHDQVGNRAYGERLAALTGAPMLRALRAILLLSPHVPLLFMGEEHGETRPFCFFTDYRGDLADAVREGRRREFAGFAAFAGTGDEGLAHIPDPNAESTFLASKLDWSRRAGPEGQAELAEVRALLGLRRQRIVPHLAGVEPGCGTVLSHEDGALAVDWRLNGALLKLRANLGAIPRALLPARGERIFMIGDDARAEAMPPFVAVYLETP
ncbi:malto-oligosyltrehalose trehalohydrolase [Rubellimicrobium roseum]|uniref:Malto-oligosyltrehalose trehalohydrolase n=1 Tax=Rubellimicrobium roseum TaxID=687525 RepID=A0A5C4NLI9_9RHOB|nr:malto-oligosyltrehalose trehalohydrolase [Rubellimicrobium roseum]TNC74248.1 malto-oligosyltrehalose trehalohydrolase [Rubellimicrobium roseum]